MHTRIRFFSSHLFIALALCSSAAIQHFWLAPRLERLPADYASETSYAASCRFHLTPAAPAEEYDLVARRRDVALTSMDGHSIIQGDTHWTTPAGVVTFKVQNLYGVDRATRANAVGLGNADRNGQYFFPPHTEQRTYGLWDPFYTGPRVATYHHTEQLDGLTVYVFNFIAEDLDETAGYVSLPDVPEKYRASTDGRGKIAPSVPSRTAAKTAKTAVIRLVRLRWNFMSALPPWSGGVRTAKKRCWSDDVRGHRPPRMGGIILLESEVDQGTTFHFTAQFGLSSSSMWEGPERPDLRAGDRGTEAHPTLSTMRILIAEDNAINRVVVTGILAKRGHTLVHAENGREAAEAFARASFHVVLMDIQMPEMDGYEATRRIRRMERATGRRTAIVAMTAHAMTGDRERCLASGMDGYLSKPLEKAALIAVLDGVSQSGVFTVSTAKFPGLLNEAAQIRTAVDEFDLALSAT
ncbi:MAG: response regulator [Blastocatellia bacterium]|nr:response regulator [Blastocatellia bacterium]